MDNIEKKLTAVLYRTTCPESVELGEYHLGQLAVERQTAVAEHLITCPHCARELAQLDAFLASVAPDLETSLVERVKVWIARLLPDPGLADATLRPAFAVRGREEGPLFYEAGDAQLSLEIQDDPARPGDKMLLGLLIGVEVTNVEAHLWQEETRLATVPVNEIGNFLFPHLTAGRYKLILAGPDFEIHVEELVI